MGFKPAPATTSRVARWYTLLIDVGIADQLQAIIDAVSEAKSRRKPLKVTVEDQARMSEMTQDEIEALLLPDDFQVEIKMDFISMVKKLGSGGLVEFASIVAVAESEEDDFNEMTMGELRECAAPFVDESMTPIKLLIGTGSSII